MHWTLSSAVLRCSARRARRAVAAGPLVASLVAVIVVTFPLSALLLGRQLAPFVDAASVNPVLAKVLAATIVVPALALGLAVGALLPGNRVLGTQLVAAPATAFTRFVGLTLVPLAVLALPLTVSALIGAAAASAGAPAGPWLAAAIVGAFLAAAGSGAALAAAVGAATSSLRLTPLPAAVAVTWASVGAVAGEPVLGVGAWLAKAATAGAPTAATAALVAFGVTSAAVAIWGLSSGPAGRDRSVRGDVRLGVRLPRGARAAFGIAVAARLVRHCQIRRHIAIATLFALGGTVLLRAVGAGETGASYLPFAAALFAVAAIPPAAAALRLDADWLLRVCPHPPRALARAAATASLFVAAATVVLMVGVAAPVAVLDPGAWPLAEASAAMVVAAAIAGGALVPWRPDRVVEQTASYVVVGALAAVGSYALSRSAAEAAAIGVPEGVFACVAANGAVVGAIAFAGVFER